MFVSCFYITTSEIELVKKGLIESIVMKICVINPNSTKSMTASICNTAKKIASETTEIICFTPDNGPESIEGYYDGVFGALGTLEGIQKYPDADGYIIACFDDTGLDAARSYTKQPIVGIGEAGFHAACLIAENFTVITTLPRSVNIIRNNLEKYGLIKRCTNVRASNIAVLDLENLPNANEETISNQVKKAIEEDHGQAIVLGCAGMSDFASELSKKHSIPIIDGVSSAVFFVEGLIRSGLKSSNLGGYEQPRKKKYKGQLQRFEPK